MISQILGALTIVFFIVLAKRNAKVDCIRLRETYINMEYKGLIMQKFEDMENQALPTLTIISEKKQSKTFGSFRETSGLYNYSQVGDSIIKEKGSLKVQILRADKDTIFNLDFNCPE